MSDDDLDVPKLVRDRIPEIIRENGETPITHVAEGEEYDQWLGEKLVEEACEFAEDGTRDELADVLEVVYAVCEHRGIEWGEIERMRAEKADERGGFADGIVLEDVRDR